MLLYFRYTYRSEQFFNKNLYIYIRLVFSTTHLQSFVQWAPFKNAKNIQFRNVTYVEIGLQRPDMGQIKITHPPKNASYFIDIYWVTLEKTYEDRTPFMLYFLSNKSTRFVYQRDDRALCRVTTL